MASPGDPVPIETVPPKPGDDRPLAFQIVRGGAAVALTSYFLFGFGFVSNLVLTRLLAPSDFGIFALGTFFFALLNLRPKLGTEQAFAQQVRTDATTSGTFAGLSLAGGVGSLGLALIVAPVLRALGYADGVIVVTLALAGVGLMDSVMGIAWVQLDKALLFTRVSVVTAVCFPLSYLPAFYLAWNGGGYWSLVAQNATYALLLLGGLWLAAREALPELWRARWAFSPMLARQFLNFGVLVGLATIFATLVYQFDNFLVGSFVGLETLGYYDRAYRIAQWSSILVGSVLTRTAFYAYSRLQDDPVRLTRTAMMSLWIVTTVAVPIALAIFVTADSLVSFLFGSRWAASALFLRFLVAYSILRPLLDDAGSLFVAVGHPRRTTIVTILQALTIVAAATPLTFALGAVGTALGVGVTFVVGLAVTYYFVRRTLPKLDLRAALFGPAIATVITIALGWPAANWVQAQSLGAGVSLFLEGAAVIALYLVLTVALNPRRARERTRYVWRLLRMREAVIAAEAEPE